MQKLSISEKKLLVSNEMLKTFPSGTEYNLRTAFIKWWINSGTTGGLRLTSTGYNLLKMMQYDRYHFNAKKLSTSGNLLLMDQNLECPYYIDGIGITKSKRVIFGSKEATMIKLYGDFNDFLDTFR